MRKSLLAAFCFLGLTVAGNAAARAPVNVPNVPAPTPGSWAQQLVEVANLVKPQGEACSTHCWVLERLHLTGAVDKGKVDFELSGELLEKGAYAIPLFGPANTVRLEGVTENGAPATLGFEDGHYWVHTTAPRFTIRGKLVLPEDRTVTVVGPLDTLDADVTGGRITEGAHVTALAGTQLHFDAEGAAPPSQPPVFSIARALRVGKNIEFEYKLTAQSGENLGVVHLPLRYGERVIDVAGSTGWRVEGEDLLLPTTGKNADITVTGTVANVSSLSPDPRAPFEWWLLESDGEHRVLATGDAKQHDASESPIVRRQPNSRLFLVQRGQHLDVTVQTLQSVDVLAATVRSHSRMLVLTSAGDLVAQDVLAYDNNGLDYLYFTPDGKPLYLATDGASERVMHKDGSDDLMIPMRLGQHTLTVQTLSHTSVGALFGRIAMPGPRVPLATASEELTVGLPEAVHPLVVTGGEHTQWPVSSGDGVALALSALAAALALSGWKKRALGTASLFGLWFVSKPLFAVALGAGVVAIAWPLFARLGKTTRRVTLGLALLGAFAVGVPLLVSRSQPTVATSGVAYQGAEGDLKEKAVTTPTPAEQSPAASHAATVADAPAFGVIAQDARATLGHAGILDGVRPVALTMPAYAHATFASRQLVTPSRTFQPVVYYVTDTGLALAWLAWLACAGGLAWLSRDRLRALRDKLRAALAAKPEATPAPPVPEPTAAE
jgi:hypothetical protein